MREIAAGVIVYCKTTRARTHADSLREITSHLTGQAQTSTEIKFLILYHGRGYWNFPKGKIESEEKSWQAAVRELREETGLKLTDLRFKKNFRTYEKFIFRRQKEKVFKIVIFYLAETRQPRIALSHEHQGYGWFTYREAMKILGRHKDSQRVLTQANEFIHHSERGHIPSSAMH